MTSRRLIRIKVLQLLYAYLKRESISLGEIENSLTNSLSKSSDLYFHGIQLLLDIRQISHNKIDAARNRRMASKADLNPNTRFIDNPIFTIIEENLQYQFNVNTRFISWTNEQEIVYYFHNKMVESDLYKEYMNAKEVSFEQHKQFILNLFTELILTDDVLYDTLENKNIFWNDDYELVFSLVYKTLKGMKASYNADTNFIHPIFNEPDDSNFGKTLLRKTIMENAKNLELVEQFTRNWEIERISDIDKAILSEAIAELRYFPSIPVKVTMDEFIEIAKTYSSAKSCSFINGILDNVVATLKEKNELVKTGRGLIDEKKK